MYNLFLCRFSVIADLPDQQAGDQVENEGHDEQHQGDFDQGAGVKGCDRFGEFIGDDAGHGIPRSQEGGRTLDTIADDHCDCHRFAQRAPQSQNYSPQDTGTAVRQQDLPNGFPFGSAKWFPIG